MQNLSCEKRDRLLFDNLNFEINPGELWHIQGMNGAGKTSLLRILCGLSQPTSGQVLWQQQDITRQRDEYYHQLIYLGHKPGVNLSLTACDNLKFWCQQHAVTQNQDFYPLLAQIGLVGLEDIPAGHLSAGQLRRVALCRLWLKNTKLWILDEPFTALDVRGIELLKNRMKQHLAYGGLIVLTSHQQLELDANVTSMTLEYRI